MDPYYEKLTLQYKVRKVAIAIWPSIYGFINTIVTALVDNLKAMIDSIKKSF